MSAATWQNIAGSKKLFNFRRVGGYMNNDEWFDEAETLDSLISQKGFQVNSEYFYANGYNSPMQFWSRRNEVWKVKA